MTEKIPSELENNGNIDNVDLKQEKPDFEISEKALKELEEEKLDIAFRQSETAEDIRRAQAKKGKEIEEFGGTAFKAPVNYNYSNDVRNKFFAGLFTIASFLGIGLKAKAGEPVDSLNKKKPVPERIIGGIEVKEGLKIRELTGAERQDWNAFLDFVKEKGLEGSEKLDKGSDKLARSLFTEYKKLNPETTINYDIVASVQYEMQKLKENVQGFAKRRNDPNANNLMNFVSKVDGWFGQQTSKSRFPFMIENQYHNDNLVSSKNLGLVNSRFESEKQAQKMKRIPTGAKVEQLADGLYYENADGDLIKVLDK